MWGELNANITVKKILPEMEMSFFFVGIRFQDIVLPILFAMFGLIPSMVPKMTGAIKKCDYKW